MADEPEVISFEDYAIRNDAPQFVWDVATHRLPNTSPGQRKRIQAQQRRQQQANARKRVKLFDEYTVLVNEGKIRPPTHQERLIETARGHDGNLAVEAARRILTRRGIDWNNP